MDTPENQSDHELKLMADMLADLCAAISQILKTRWPAMPPDQRFNYAYCMSVRLMRNHVQTEFVQTQPAASCRQN